MATTIFCGDISDSDGLVDYIYAGMGNDVVRGGPGMRAPREYPKSSTAATASTRRSTPGRYQDYSITINGDGSYEVVDLRPESDTNAAICCSTTASTI